MEICSVSEFPQSQRGFGKHDRHIARELPDPLPHTSAITHQRDSLAELPLCNDARHRNLKASTLAERLRHCNCIQFSQYVVEENISELFMTELHAERRRHAAMVEQNVSAMASMSFERAPIRVSSRFVIFRAAAPRWVPWM